MTVNDNVLVTAKVRHSQQMNATPLHPWIIASKTGTVEAAHCNCKAGLGETCSHVGALLFHIESTHRLTSRVTVTQVKAYWSMPSAVDKVPYAEVGDIDFTSVATKKRRLDCQINGEDIQERSSQKLPDVPEPTAEERCELLRELHVAKTRASVLTVSTGFQDEFIPEILQDGKLPKPLVDLRDDRYLEMSPETLREHCIELGKSITVTPEQAVNVERLTRDQSKCKEWFRFRLGRITASNMKSVCSTSTEHPAISTVQAVCGSKPFRSKATDYGLKHESEALKAYETTMRSQHENFSVTKSGLSINSNYPYIGASPDGFINCDCCGEGLVEVKCPYTAKDKGLSCVDYISNGQLRDKHKYSYQVQTQLTVTQKDYCDFVVWSPSEILVQRVEPNPDLEQEILEKSRNFFVHVILPELTGSLISRERFNKQTDQQRTLFSDVCLNSQSVCNSETEQLNSKTQPQSIDKTQPKVRKTLLMPKLTGKKNSSCLSDCFTSGLRCVCGDVITECTEKTVKCANENCPHGLLHFQCISIKKKPKPPYYCPTCRQTMWK